VTPKAPTSSAGVAACKMKQLKLSYGDSQSGCSEGRRFSKHDYHDHKDVTFVGKGE
jgi:hypothetical protein